MRALKAFVLGAAGFATVFSLSACSGLADDPIATNGHADMCVYTMLNPVLVAVAAGPAGSYPAGNYQITSLCFPCIMPKCLTFQPTPAGGGTSSIDIVSNLLSFQFGSTVSIFSIPNPDVNGNKGVCTPCSNGPNPGDIGLHLKGAPDIHYNPIPPTNPKSPFGYYTTYP